MSRGLKLQVNVPVSYILLIKKKKFPHTFPINASHMDLELMQKFSLYFRNKVQTRTKTESDVGVDVRTNPHCAGKSCEIRIFASFP